MSKLEIIDRSVFEAIRLEIVKAGYLPDIAQYASNEDYNTAKDALANTKKFLIEVFGIGSSESRDEKISTKITIDRVNNPIGDIGSFGIIEFKAKEGGQFDKYMLPSGTMDLHYDIRIITNSTKRERISQEIVLKALGLRKYLKAIGTEESYLIYRDAFFNLSAQRLLEYSIRYVVKDVYLEDCELIGENIPPLTQVTPEIGVGTVQEIEEITPEEPKPAPEHVWDPQIKPVKSFK